ncbi:MAG: F420-dependent glucose-6-phosphate dehydrogenase [Alphaproteobacteria bacterium MarineAlpha11_Bin1]|nr:MAG: F420-dependent glucose-6-phosphate dehydrogenase [Alphaproteobacteria bacterium MarineAlpha11_Bin1]|tara:strand:- start:4785 stop:5726 length:942 start_codon:yes stop_codon:yes gene_type:complete
MSLQLGYLLPTRERIMVGNHDVQEILALGDLAEDLGVDSVWIGDSLLAKPRHDPLTLIGAIAGRTNRVKIGTAVLLPMLRNPVLLAHQVATLDQISEGRIILGIGTARDVPAIRNEFDAAGVPFDKRIGRMLEQMRLCRSLWDGQPVEWDGLWTFKKSELAPRPFTVGGPAIWSGGGVEAALKRSGRYFNGWFPSGAGNGKDWSEGWQGVQRFAKEADRDPADIIGAAYVTLAVNEKHSTADAELNAYLEGYYLRPADEIRKQQYCFAGTLAGAVEWLGEFVAAGASHMCIRFTGSNDAAQMEQLIRIREELA